MAQELVGNINMGSKAHLTSINYDKLNRQMRRPEDAERVAATWDEVFGRYCEACNRKHARHSRCEKGDDA